MKTLTRLIAVLTILLPLPVFAVQGEGPPLQNLCADASVSGTVKDANGVGIAQAEAWFYEEFSNVRTKIVADGAGVYGDCLPHGSYGVSFYKSGYLYSVYNNKQWGCGDTLTLAAGETHTNLDAVLPTGGTIAGTVTDGVVPLPGISVLVSGIDLDARGNALTDVGGNYQVRGLPTGSYRVWFRGVGAMVNHGLEYYNDRLIEGEADAVAVTAGSVTGGIDAAMPPGGTISGTVDDGSNPISGLQVSALLPDGMFARSDATDGTGAYTIPGLKAGTYHVRFGQSQGFMEMMYGAPVTVVPPGDTGGIDGTLIPGGSISGTVTDGSAGLAVTDVYAIDSTGETAGRGGADAAGNYTIRGLPSGEYRVNFWALPTHPEAWFDQVPTVAGATKVTVTAPADTPNIDAQLPPFTGGAVSGRVTFGGPSCAVVDMALFPVHAIDDDWYRDSDGIGPSGTWYVDGLPPDDYRVLADADERSGLQDRWYSKTSAFSLSRTVRVTAAQERTNVNIHFPDPGRLPVADLKIGEFDHAQFLGPGEKEPVVLNMDCNKGRGLPVDWWLLAFTHLPPPNNIYHFEVGRGWKPGLEPTLQGPCGDRGDFTITELPFVPAVNGDVDIFFGVDADPNGTLDRNQLFYDGTRVHMYR